MIAATAAVQRPVDARLLAIDSDGRVRHLRRDDLLSLLTPGDVVIANDAATLPASLHGVHVPTRRSIEVRLAARRSLAPSGIARLTGVVFGEGDFHQRTEDRPSPPPLATGDVLALGPLRARVDTLLGHPRLVALRLEGTARDIWAGLARHGRPIQYSHLPVPLELWDSWTPIAGVPAAFEPPSAGFALSWQMIDRFARHDVRFATLTHAAGISSTGDRWLDARLPLDEAYRIPRVTARLVNEAVKDRHRIIAVGTSVVRALEHAAASGLPLRPGEGLASNRISADTRLRIVTAVLSGTHEPGTSHYDLLRAFAPDTTLALMNDELERSAYRTHEFGDSIFLARNLRRTSSV